MCCINVHMTVNPFTFDTDCRCELLYMIVTHYLIKMLYNRVILNNVNYVDWYDTKHHAIDYFTIFSLSNIALYTLKNLSIASCMGSAVVSLSKKKLYIDCSVLVGSRIGFESVP